MRTYLRIFLMCMSISHISLYAQEIQIPLDTAIHASVQIETVHPFTDSLIAYGKTYVGLPYKTTSRAPWQLDCSGYVAMLYAHFGVTLPRSSYAMAQATQTIDIADAKPGDLIFFKGRDIFTNRVGHVAVIIAVSDTSLTMMHSTVKKGIIIETYPDAYYYTIRFVKIGRVVL